MCTDAVKYRIARCTIKPVATQEQHEPRIWYFIARNLTAAWISEESRNRRITESPPLGFLVETEEPVLLFCRERTNILSAVHPAKDKTLEANV